VTKPSNQAFTFSFIDYQLASKIHDIQLGIRLELKKDSLASLLHLTSYSLRAGHDSVPATSIESSRASRSSGV